MVGVEGLVLATQRIDSIAVPIRGFLLLIWMLSVFGCIVLSSLVSSSSILALIAAAAAGRARRPARNQKLKCNFSPLALEPDINSVPKPRARARAQSVLITTGQVHGRQCA